MSVYDRLGVPTLINARGTVTRLSGGMMRAEAVSAMAEASTACVDMADLQAAASREIAALTGAEAGYVASGAAACLLLAAAAVMARLDPARMARLPDTRGMPDELVMVRSQRNAYDHALRGAGAVIVEVGLPDRYAGAGVRDAALWEIEAAICERTAAIVHVASRDAMPPLPDVAALARRRGIPVIVDAAAELPPQSNLTRFVAEGADLVAFSGGKAIGGPQASGFLAGRRDLVMSAALQHLDLDVHEDLWCPPPGLVDRDLLPGLPRNGIGRPCKVGKEEVVGLLTALRLFVEEGDAARHARWLARLRPVEEAIRSTGRADVRIEGGTDTGAVPLLAVKLRPPAPDAAVLIRRLLDGDPAIHVDDSRRHLGEVVINPIALAEADLQSLAGRLADLLSR
jgi:L-seryl-tRNA(Ser) seleniumtransferase